MFVLKLSGKQINFKLIWGMCSVLLNVFYLFNAKMFYIIFNVKPAAYH